MIHIPPSQSLSQSLDTPTTFDVPDLSDFLSRAPAPPLQACGIDGIAGIADQSLGMIDELTHPAKPFKRGPAPPDLCPFTIAIDHRERAAAYPFANMQTGSKRGYRPVVVEKEMKHLPTGDYSIVGLENLVTVERKQLSDALSTLANRHEQFRAEHERMAKIIAIRDPITGTPGRACVVIEASWETIRQQRSRYTRMTLDSIWGTFVTWQAEFGVPWHLMEGRRLAERFTWDFLRKWWEGRERDGERAEKEKINGTAGCGCLVERLCEELL